MKTIHFTQNSARGIFFVGLFLLCLVLGAPQAWASSGCQGLTGTANLTAKYGIWVGDLSLTMGTQQLQGSVSVMPNWFETKKAFANERFAGSETWALDVIDDSGESTLNAEDHFYVQPTDDQGNFHITAVAHITFGFGKFQDAFGEMLVQGDGSFVQGVATTTLKGKICGLAQ